MKITKVFFSSGALLAPFMIIAMHWTPQQVHQNAANLQAQQILLTQQYNQLYQHIKAFQQAKQQTNGQIQISQQAKQQIDQQIQILLQNRRQLDQQENQAQQQWQQLDQQEKQVISQVNQTTQQYQQVSQSLNFIQQQLQAMQQAPMQQYFPAVQQYAPAVQAVQVQGSQINSFSQWKSFCDAQLVPFNGIKQDMLQYLQNHGLHTFLSAQELARALQAFEGTMKQEFSVGKFVNPTQKNPTILQDLLNNTQFAPFVQKMILPSGVLIFSCSDIHGDIKALNAFVGDLVKRGVINDQFVLQRPEVRLIFQGDYVDCGWHGVEVLYLLMRLKIANPDKVIVLRGNHEEQGMNENENSMYAPFIWELRAKYNNPNLNQAIYQSYRLMPVAAYIGVEDHNHDIDYSLHTHAFIEIGFNPLYLLNNPQAHFTFVPAKMDRNKIFTNILNALKMPLPVGRYSDQCTELKYLGFCYGDITVTGAPYDLYYPVPNKIYTVNSRGQNVAEKTISYYNDISQNLKNARKFPNKHTIRILVRGHQHVAQTSQGRMNPLFPDILRQGHATAWHPPMGAVLRPNGVWQGEVVSLWSSPSHEPWNHFQNQSWKQQSAVILQLNSGFNNWNLQAYNIQVP